MNPQQGMALNPILIWTFIRFDGGYVVKDTLRRQEEPNIPLCVWSEQSSTISLGCSQIIMFTDVGDVHIDERDHISIQMLSVNCLYEYRPSFKGSAWKIH